MHRDRRRREEPFVAPFDAGFSGLSADDLLMPRRQRVACFKLRNGALPDAKKLGEFGLRHLENVLADDSDSAHTRLIISFPNIVNRKNRLPNKFAFVNRLPYIGIARYKERTGKERNVSQNRIRQWTRRMMAEKRMTQSDLSAALGLSQSSISARLHDGEGAVDFKIHEIESLERLFNQSSPVR